MQQANVQQVNVQTDIEIARAAHLKPIAEIAARLGLSPESLIPYGKHIAKVDLGHLNALPPRNAAKLVLVTAISPTPAGEGKTTTTVGLGDALARIGRKVVIALREPSLGPCFGMKGGAAGGGKAQVVPMEQINLHFTGDFHAITSANNLLAAMVDNHIHWGNALGFDTRRVVWRRALDMNDRALRQIVSSLGGTGNGVPREDGFDITVASEVMAVFCLATDLADLTRRLGSMIVGYRRDKSAIHARDLKAEGAMTALLRDALAPNLVQTLEGTPAFVHGGPFANIAHGCNSVIATQAALKLADFVITEAGFGADLGAEKFLDIKCRKAGLKPSVAVVVATIRALKHHGGVSKSGYGVENLAAVEAGLVNLARHVGNMRKFGLPIVVALNHFSTDTDAEHGLIARYCRDVLHVDAVVCRHWAEGGAGAEELAHKVVALAEANGSAFHPLYPDDLPLWEKVRTIASEIYHASDIEADAGVVKRFAEIEKAGYGSLPVCIAKTQYSFSTDPDALGAPSGHRLKIRDITLSAGAGFLVVVCGDIMRMPGLPKSPAAERIFVDGEGRIDGLF